MIFFRVAGRNCPWLAGRHTKNAEDAAAKSTACTAAAAGSTATTTAGSQRKVFRQGTRTLMVCKNDPVKEPLRSIHKLSDKAIYYTYIYYLYSILVYSLKTIGNMETLRNISGNVRIQYWETYWET